MDGTARAMESPDGSLIYTTVSNSYVNTTTSKYSGYVKLYANAAAGTPKWNKTIYTYDGADYGHGQYARPVYVKADNSVIVYVSDYNNTLRGKVVAYDKDGNQRWTTSISGMPSVSISNDENMLYIAETFDSSTSSYLKLYAYDANYILRWTRTLLNYTNQHSLSVKIVKIWDNGNLLVSAGEFGGQGGIFLYDANGALLWNQLSDGYPSVRLSNDGNTIYAAFNFQLANQSPPNVNNYVVKLYALNQSGSLKWNKTIIDYHGNESIPQFYSAILEIGGNNNAYIVLRGIGSNQYSSTIMNYDVDGNLLWEKNADGSAKVYESPDKTMVYIVVNFSSYVSGNYTVSSKINAYESNGTQKWSIPIYSYLGNDSQYYTGTINYQWNDGKILFTGSGAGSNTNGDVIIFDSSGNQLLRQPILGGSPIYVNLSADNSMLYVLSGYINYVGNASALTLYGIPLDSLIVVQAPTVSTLAATDIQSTGAKLQGTVNPNGWSTTYQFEYGLTSNYGTTTPSTDAGSGIAIMSVNHTVTNLSPGAAYHYRIIATSTAGAATAADMTFTTTSVNAATITGRASVNFVGHSDLGVANATVSLKGTAYSTTTDSNGSFTLTNVPLGSYDLVVTSPDLKPFTQQISLTGQTQQITIPPMTTPIKGDTNADNRLGIEDVIYLLQVVSGIRQ